MAPEREWRDGQLERMLAEWVAMTRRARDSGLPQEVLHDKLAAVYNREDADNERSLFAPDAAFVFGRADMENENGWDGGATGSAERECGKPENAGQQTGGNHD